MVYKIVSKMLVNKLKLVLDDVIYESQSAFVLGRFIAENIMLTFIMSHWPKHKNQGKVGYSALKIDISKSYDKMEWDFLEAMLHKLGFSNRIVDVLMMCICVISYRIMIGVTIVGFIISEKGLRQGDPISPYLFFLWVKIFLQALQKAEAQEDIHGIKIAKDALAISRLFFFDDSFLFFRATDTVCQLIRKILSEYEAASC